jgi:hypothetical protein
VVKRDLIRGKNTIARSVGTDQCSGIERHPVHARQVIDHADPTDKSFVCKTQKYGAVMTIGDGK